MKSRVLLAICVAFAMLATSTAFADNDALKKAQASFDAAQSDYLAGKFDEAAAGFQEAYAARPFPQFLYNVGASFHMKGKQKSDVAAYKKAVEFYKRYLQEEPTATDKPKVEKAVGVLEAEIKRLDEAAAGQGSGSGAPVQGPSQEVQQLGDVKVHGLVVIVTEPQGATVYLDSKKSVPLATTPWSGSIDGEHKLIIEKQGYKRIESTISADPTKLVQVVSSMAQEDYLTWVKVTSNVPGSDVYIDDKSVGAVGITPFSQNIAPGKHTFWVSKEGYDEYTITKDIAPGTPDTITATIKGTPQGKLNVTGYGIEDSTISIDGKVLCERGPCLKSVGEGDHEITVSRPDYKTYSRRIRIEAKTETSVKVTLAPTPSRSDAVVAYVVGAVFGGAGIYLGTQANKLRDDLNNEIATGTSPPASNDKRLLYGKIYAIGADAAFAISGITLLTAVYYTFRDKGAPSTALIDAKSVTVRPDITPQYAGVGMEVHW